MNHATFYQNQFIIYHRHLSISRTWEGLPFCAVNNPGYRTCFRGKAKWQQALGELLLCQVLYYHTITHECYMATWLAATSDRITIGAEIYGTGLCFGMKRVLNNSRMGEGGGEGDGKRIRQRTDWYCRLWKKRSFCQRLKCRPTCRLWDDDIVR
jgi:hypothetical protein